jgi:KDO2-lipid IV(A) lauroyltransferase
LKSIIAQIPKGYLLFFGKILGNLLYCLAVRQRRIVNRNLRFSLVATSQQQIQSMAKKIFQNFAITILEFLQMSCLSKQELISKVHVEGEEILIEAAAKKKGIVLITAHLGNYEMVAQCAPCLLGLQLSAVAKSMRNVWLNRFIHNLRTRFGNKIIYKKGALPEMMQTLRRGAMVGILMDISRRFDGVEVNFFGRRATATPAAVLLGLRCKSPIITGFCYRNPKGQLIAQVEPPVEIRRTGDLRSDLQFTTQLITDRVERAIRRHPEQWNWMLKRWKDFYPDLYPESEKRLRRIKKKEIKAIFFYGKKKINMSKYIKGQEILKHWDIKSFELFDYVKNGLKAYTKTGRIFHCPPEYNLKTKLDNINEGIAKLEAPNFPKGLSYWDEERLTYDAPEIVQDHFTKAKIEIVRKLSIVEMGKDDQSRYSWYYCDLPDSEKNAEQLINRILNSYFFKHDVFDKLGPAKKGAGDIL